MRGPLLAAVVLLGGCGLESTAPPVSTGRGSATAAQPANSLPPGAAVNAPLLSGPGVATTRVGPR